MDRANPEPAMEMWHASRIPIARSTARQCRSISATPTCSRGGAASSWATPLDELLAERMPDMLEQFGITRCLTDVHRVARPREVNLEHILDPAGTCREQDDAVSQRQRFAEIVGYEQDGLLLAIPDPQQHLMHIDLGVSIERAERLVHQQYLWLNHQGSHQRRPLAHAARESGRGRLLGPF